MYIIWSTPDHEKVNNICYLPIFILFSFGELIIKNALDFFIKSV